MKSMKTYNTKPSQVESQWHVFDAKDQILGRLATEVSGLLQGKHKPIYARHILTGDYVIVVNASKIRVTGRKLEQELYRSHSNYPGALRETPMFEVLENHPDRIIRAAVRGMLPKNILGRQMLRRLKIYAGEIHPHEAQIRGQANMNVQERQAEPESPVQAEERPVAKSNEESTEDKAVS